MTRKFTLFSLLPTEIRVLIWEFCIPHRLVEIMFASTDLEINTNCELDWTSRQISLPPVITQVCRESRHVALKTGAGLTAPSVRENGREYPDWSDAPWLKRLWFDWKHDSVSLYWHLGVEDFDIRDYSAGMEKVAVDCFTWSISQMQTGDPVILADQIYSLRSSPHDRGTETYGEYQTALALHKQYTLCLRVISVHMTAIQALQSDLWGLTGEELIQLVEPTDITRLKMFGQAIPQEDEWAHSFLQLVFDKESFAARLEEWREKFRTQWVWNLWEACALRSGFDEIGTHPEEVWLGPQVNEIGDPLNLLEPSTYMLRLNEAIYMLDEERWKLNLDHPWAQKIIQGMPRFKEVIMFRLCIQNCHRLPPQPPLDLYTKDLGFSNGLSDKENKMWRDAREEALLQELKQCQEDKLLMQRV
ncbi:hypothetical protein N7493_004942 [Penicillium malachiteum]|uniref:2EXR domain-containing protein n=1 Tax=Penicillium malachiteum TaxID=1324776 RepID=A0AAD6MW94_9EURO|nr:hypothetical protein N7493_004942 [Penicillium malachiteum]